jgi:tripartite-type tricarboxylate transporter receptor subunit TctC
LSALPSILIVPPSIPPESVKDLIASANSRPGALNHGSAGIGSANHLNTELFTAMWGTIKQAPQEELRSRLY